MLLVSLIAKLIPDAACTALSTAGIPLDLDASAACGAQMSLVKALVVPRGQECLGRMLKY